MRKQFTAVFKTKIVIESLRESKPLTQIAVEHDVNPALVSRWRSEALDELPKIFERRSSKDADIEESERKIAELYEQIGRLTTQVSWLKKKSGLDPDAR